MIRGLLQHLEFDRVRGPVLRVQRESRSPACRRRPRDLSVATGSVRMQGQTPRITLALPNLSNRFIIAGMTSSYIVSVWERVNPN
jgi:hypothetical protein